MHPPVPFQHGARVPLLQSWQRNGDSMKKILCLFFACICIFTGFSGCSSQEKAAEAVESSIAAAENETSEADINTTESEASDSASDTPSELSGEEASEQQQNTVSKAPQRQNSDGKSTTQDKYKTDPVPDGKPLPAEPEDQNVDTKKTYTCTFSIECSSILNHLDALDSDKLDIVPENGVILSSQTVTFHEGESVYDVLQRVCRENKIHMEASWTPMYNSAYIEGIANLYEFDCGSGSGWMYCVDGWYPNYGCSRYQLKQGERVEWRYTCNLGKDIGGANAVG